MSPDTCLTCLTRAMPVAPSMWSLCGPGLGAGPGPSWVDGWGLVMELAPAQGTVRWGMGWHQRGGSAPGLSRILLVRPQPPEV